MEAAVLIAPVVVLAAVMNFVGAFLGAAGRAHGLGHDRPGGIRDPRHGDRDGRRGRVTFIPAPPAGHRHQCDRHRARHVRRRLAHHEDARPPHHRPGGSRQSGGVARSIVIAWVLTIPLAAMMAGIAYWLLHLVLRLP
jgi:hypothetical protein